MCPSRSKRSSKLDKHSDSPEFERIGLLEKKIDLLKKQISYLKKNNQIEFENESKYRSLFEMSDDAILVIEDGRFVDCNRAVVKMLGYKSKKQVLNTHPADLSPLRQPDGVPSFEKAQEMIALAAKNGSHHFEWIHTRANGQNFPVEVWLCSFKHKGKTLINTIWRDLSEKKRSEALILKNVQEKEILLKEIHHRVKNNLQIISSLLNLQSASISDTVLYDILQQSKYRVESMAKIHEMLYQSKDLSRICFGNYVKQLTVNLIKSAKGIKHSIKTNIDIDNVYFTINTAIPLGLIINELVSNSLKHGISGASKGMISIGIVRKNTDLYELRISDDGIGFSDNFSPDNFNTLGFQLIFSLVEQMDAFIKKVPSKKGTQYVLEFPYYDKTDDFIHNNY